MYNLLAIEWLKVRKYRTFWVLQALFAVAVALTIYAILGLDIGPLGEMILAKAYSIKEFTYNICFFASHFVIFLAVLMCILYTNELQFKTSRQNVIDGWSRVQFFHAKWAVILHIALATTLFVALTTVVSALLNDISFINTQGALVHLGYFFLLTVNYLGFGLILGVLLRRAGLAIAILLLYYMLEQIFHMMIAYKSNGNFAAGDFLLPLEVSDQLMPLPGVSRMVEEGGKILFTPFPTWTYALGTLGWIAVYYFAGRSMLQRRDW